MKKHVLSFVALMFCVSGFAQNIVTIDVSQKQDGAFSLRNNNVIITGEVLNGLKDGVWVESQPTTELPKVIISYKDGMKNGIYLDFDKNGALQRKREFKNDTINGSSISYRNGRLESMSTYSKGVLEGLKITCYDRGTRQEESEYRNGKRHGVTTWYTEDGKKLAVYTYKDGNFDGVQETFYSDGKSKSIKMYANNILEGVAQEFYPSGALKSETIYKNGKVKKSTEFKDETPKVNNEVKIEKKVKQLKK